IAVGAERVTVAESIGAGHKVALRAHTAGDAVVKYGWPIGRATKRIEPGEHVHAHNLSTALTPEASFEFLPLERPAAAKLARGWRGYRRGDGRAATRNELWIIPTVGCVARTAEFLATAFRERLSEFPNIDGVHAFPHAFGCSQLGDDLKNTQKILAGLATHPNAGGALIIGLGCENNYLEAFRPFLGEHDTSRIRALVAQQAGDEFEEGLALLGELAERANQDTRVELPVSSLVVGLKCGGSDGLSGITANPLLGRFAARLSASDGVAILTEVPEMFGAEGALFARCVDHGVFDRAAALVQGFRRYYADHGQPVYENPSPGNKAGGITTLEEKSLGCVQKGGDAPITDVVRYGERASRPGLTLLQAPGNDQVSTTALAAAGATLVLFTTGRGTPLGSPVPTLKVATNSDLAKRKPTWIDFDAGALVQGRDREETDGAFVELVLEVASGKRARNEQFGQRDIAIFKDGVTL
ncbi:MAG TPA: altronate dehydratase family protein, partial [Polyangiaceae bacterium]